MIGQLCGEKAGDVFCQSDTAYTRLTDVTDRRQVWCFADHRDIVT